MATQKNYLTFPDHRL